MRRLLLTCAVLAACVRPSALSSGSGTWHDVFVAANLAAYEGRYAAADSMLAGVMSDRWGTEDAREAAYWRAVYLLDPQNSRGSAREALALLELYLGDPAPATYTQSARALWALASRQDSLRFALMEASARPDTVVQATPRTTPTAREEELQKELTRLKEQLDQTTAELERIRRRLTTPP